MPVPDNLPTIKATLTRIHAGTVDAIAAKLGHEREKTRKLALRRTHGRVTLGLAVSSAGLGALTFFDVPAVIPAVIAAATAVSKALEPSVASDDQVKVHADWIEAMKGARHDFDRLAAEIEEHCAGHRALNLVELKEELQRMEKTVSDATTMLELGELRAMAKGEVEASAVADARRALEALIAGEAPAAAPVVPADALPEFARDVVPVTRGGIA